MRAEGPMEVDTEGGCDLFGCGSVDVCRRIRDGVTLALRMAPSYGALMAVGRVAWLPSQGDRTLG